MKSIIKRVEAIKKKVNLRTDGENWKTINGAHILVDEDGELTGKVGKKIKAGKIISTGANWSSGLSKDEKGAIGKITGGSWKSKTAASKMVDDLRKYGAYALTSAGNKIMESADAAIEKFKLEEPIKAYRGGSSSLLGKSGMSFNEMKKMVGKKVQDNSYMSTSIDKEQASGFASGGVMYEIDYPSGKGIGAYVADVSKHKDEMEFLTARRCQYVVKDVLKEGSKTLVKLRYTGKGRSDIEKKYYEDKMKNGGV